MIPIRLIRSITRDTRAQIIGDAIGRTNVAAGIAYLEGTNHRRYIEKKALNNAEEKFPGGEAWVISSCIAYHKGNRNRKAKH